MSGFQTAKGVTSSEAEKSRALCLESALIIMPQISRLRFTPLEMTKRSEVQ
jgi:hypothetical protein